MQFSRKTKDDPMSRMLQVSEIYESVQGESSWAGLLCIFIRLTGCPLRCRWCDTAYGFVGGERLSIREVLGRVSCFKSKLVELTGGEPMAQDQTTHLMEVLNQSGYQILMETGGSLLLKQVPLYVNLVMDLKCPGSGMSHHNLYENLQYLKPSDNIKFVLASYEDFLWALETIEKYSLNSICQVLMSPAWGHVKPDELVSWMLETGVPARLNLQLHKYIWDPRKKGV